MSAHHDSLAILRSATLFRDVPGDELATLATAATPRCYRAGSVIMLEGEPGDSLLVVASGVLDVLRELGTPEERVINSAGPGGVLGEMSLFVNDGRRTASVRCRTDVELLEVPYATFSAALERHPRLMLTILRTIAARLLQTDHRTIGLLQERNRTLARALDELRAAQRELIQMETLQHELRVARRIQRQLLPANTPDVPGWHVAAHWEPAGDVSGDFYDFLPLRDGRLGIILGDVSGKGIPAALVMATTRAVIRAVATELDLPEAILSRVNDILAPDMTPGAFVTCALAVIDLAGGRLRLANAGQCLPYIRTATGVSELRATGMPLGLMPHSTYVAVEAHLDHGDAIVFCSDGLIEARGQAGAILGVSGVRQLLQSIGWDETPIHVLVGAATSGDPEAERDDVTVVHARRL